VIVYSHEDPSHRVKRHDARQDEGVFRSLGPVHWRARPFALGRAISCECCSATALGPRPVPDLA
jgi:hypothetical protein